MFKKTVWVVLFVSIIAVWQLSGCSKKSNSSTSKTAESASVKAVETKKTSANTQMSSSKAVASKARNETASADNSPVNNLSEVLRQSMSALQIQTPTQKLQAMDFTVTDINGKQVKLSDYRGKVVFLNFWATWCPWCVKEMPSMQILMNNLRKKYKGQFVVLAVDAGESASQVKKWLKDKNLKFHFVLDQNGQVNGMYGVRGLPSTYIVKKNGEILGRAVGARDWSTEAAHDLFETLLKE